MSIYWVKSIFLITRQLESPSRLWKKSKSLTNMSNFKKIWVDKYNGERFSIEVYWPWYVFFSLFFFGTPTMVMVYTIPEHRKLSLFFHLLQPKSDPFSHILCETCKNSKFVTPLWQQQPTLNTLIYYCQEISNKQFFLFP